MQLVLRWIRRLAPWWSTHERTPKKSLTNKIGTDTELIASLFCRTFTVTGKNCVFSRLKESRADWIRTSDLYTPSVARYQTTLQPESSFYVDFHFLTTRPEIQKRQTPRSPDSLVSIPAKSHSLTKKRQRPALDRPPELAPPTSDSGLYKKDSLSIENRRESFASPLNTKH